MIPNMSGGKGGEHMVKRVIISEKELSELVGWEPYAGSTDYDVIQDPAESFVELVWYEDEKRICVYTIPYRDQIGYYEEGDPLYGKDYEILKKYILEKGW